MIPLFPLRPLPSPVWPCVWCGRRQTLPPLPPTPSPTPTLADRHPTLPTPPPTPYPPPGQSLDSQGIINRRLMVRADRRARIEALSVRVPPSVHLLRSQCTLRTGDSVHPVSEPQCHTPSTAPLHKARRRKSGLEPRLTSFYAYQRHGPGAQPPAHSGPHVRGVCA